MDDSFTLFVYAVPADTMTRPTQDNVCDWLEAHGKSIGEGIEFKAGDTHKFFEVIHDLLQVDLLPLVGSSLMDSPDELEFCSGTLTGEALRVGTMLLHQTVFAKRSETAAFVSEKNIDPVWFLRTAGQLYEMLHACLEGGSVAFGYFE